MKNKGVFSAAILTAVLCISGNLLAYSGGTGEPNNPYQIANVTDFEQLSTTPTDWNMSFILTADINLTGLTFTQTPIAPDTDTVTLGFQGTQFIGIFDGNDHIIPNLTINAPTKDYVGLFGGVGSGGQIKNLGVVDVNITGNYSVGGLVGSNTGTLTGCYATGSVSGNWYVGGLVGENFGLSSLTDCYATGSVSGTGNIVGGLVGFNSGVLTSCYATGSVYGTNNVGGLVGYNGGIGGVLTSCYATGSVSGTNLVGGLVGVNYDATLTSCHATGPVSGNYNVGGLVGSNNSGTLTSCYATGPVTGYSIVGGLVGANEGSSSVVTSCYATGSVTGTGGDYVGGLVGKNYGTLTDCNATGSVSGVLWVGGLVGQNTGSVTSCYATGSITGDSAVGGLVAENVAENGGLGIIATITSCYATGPVTGGTGGYSVGGLVGWNDGTMTSCYATGAVNGADYVGGLVGENNYGTVTSCYATGSVTGDYDVGGLGGHQELSGTTTYCFWDTQTCFPATVGVGSGTFTGVTGKTTAEMKTLATFTSAGWDFVSTWGIFEHQAYPYLRTGLLADLNSDGVVDFKDFAIFGNQWLEGI